ncbi:hypothetical protein AVEN_27268-1 [Araneus ventricosus]|uniref:Uncharacterized protein n=1 Tax=Araneus ventricosus TaxID=182803 RepID=A0A4Y2BRG4_ARAVE|nr:hypothetical protein AVEN_27268-1 [Araneus ventricosus]
MEFLRAQYRLVTGLSRPISCQDGRSAEFSFIFRIGIISGSYSCAFWISLKDHLSSGVMVKASTEISVSILKFFSAFEQGSQPSKQSRPERTSFPSEVLSRYCALPERKKFSPILSVSRSSPCLP